MNDEDPTPAPGAPEADQERVEHYTIAEAAELLGMTKKALRGRVDRGKVSIVKGPGDVRFIPRTELERLAREAAPPVHRPLADTTPATRPAEADTDPRVVVDVNALFDQAAEAMARSAELAAMAAERHVIAARAEERAALDRRARHAAEAELAELRARVRALAARADEAEAEAERLRLEPGVEDERTDRGSGGGGAPAPEAETITRAVPRRGLWHRLTGRAPAATELAAT